MRRLISFVLVTCWATIATAQPLADRVPADALVYFGWSGTNDVPGYSGSHFEAVLKESNIPAIFKQVMPAAIVRIGREDAEAGRNLQLVYDIAAPMMKYPTAGFFSGIRTEGTQPMPKLGVVCRAGADAVGLRDRIQGLLDAAGEQDVPVRTVVDGEYFGLLIGYPGDENPLAGGEMLSADANFKACVAQNQPNSVIFLYADVEKAFALIDGIVASEANPQQKDMYDKVVDALGIRGLKRVAAASGFDGRDFLSTAFVQAPSPRTGLLAMVDGPNLGDDVLKAVPAAAEMFTAGSFDVAKLLEEIRTIAGKIDPEAKKKVDQGIGGVTLALGKNFQTDLLEPMGPHWVAYSSRDVAGGGLLGLTLINKADDPVKLKGGLIALSIFSTNTANSLIAQTDAPIQINGRQFKYGDLAINYLATPGITPSWAIQGDYAMFGLYPQTLIGASRQLSGASGKSIVENPDYLKFRERLGVKDVRGVTYLNLPATAPDSYGVLMLASRLVGVGDLFGVATPPVIIPPLHVIQEHLTPSGTVTWVDDAGIHIKNITPFPFAEIMGSSAGPSIIGMTALQTSILLPSLNRARETANRVKSASNLRQIGLANMLYANENGGKFADDLGTLARTQDINPDAFVSPRTGKQLRMGPGMSPEQIADLVESHTDYVWLGKGLTTATATADRVIAYENYERVSDGVNLLYGDGHVEFQLMNDAFEQIERARAGN